MPDEPTLSIALEPEQLAAATMRPYPRRRLGKGATSLLIILRVYVAIAVPIVVYAFVHALLTPQ
jgi:hypothetical protein